MHSAGKLKPVTTGPVWHSTKLRSLIWGLKPSTVLDAGDDGELIVMHSLRDYDIEKSAARMAVQAAAGALMSVTGHTCNDIVMCSQPREWDDMLEVHSLVLIGKPLWRHECVL